MTVNRTKPSTVYTVEYANDNGYQSSTSLQKVSPDSALLVLETTDGNFQALVNPDRIFALAKTYIGENRPPKKEGQSGA